MNASRRIYILTTICIAAALGFCFAFKSNWDRSSEAHPVVSSLDRSAAGSIEAPAAGDAAIDEDAAGEQELDGPISARARLDIAGETMQLESLDGEFSRVRLNGGEVIEITLSPQRFRFSKPVRIDADNGGSLNRRKGPVEALVAGRNGEISFTYAPGEHRGLYTVEISQGPMRELFEFWVGPEPPQGEPGPVRSYSAASTQS